MGQDTSGSGGVTGYDGLVMISSQADMTAAGVRHLDTRLWFDSTGQSISFFGQNWVCPGLTGLGFSGGNATYRASPRDLMVFQPVGGGQFQGTYFTETQLRWDATMGAYIMVGSDGEGKTFDAGGLPKSTFNAGLNSTTYEYHLASGKTIKVSGSVDEEDWHYDLIWDASYNRITQIIYSLNGYPTLKTVYHYPDDGILLSTIKTYENTAPSGTPDWGDDPMDDRPILAERFSYHEEMPYRLRHVVPPTEYRQMKVNGGDPDDASPTVLNDHAETEYAYNNLGQVETMYTHDRQYTYGFFYTRSPVLRPGFGLNEWTNLTVTTLPDGTLKSIYFNRAGQAMLKKVGGHYEGCQRFLTNGRIELFADPSAFDVVDLDTAGLVTLHTDQGLVKKFDYHTLSGKLQSVELRKGTGGVPHLTEQYNYTAHHVADFGTVYRLSSGTIQGGGSAIYEYEWYTRVIAGITVDTFQIKNRTTTLPEVDLLENGRDLTVKNVEYYDIDGYLTLTIRGFTVPGTGLSTAYTYDKLRGAMTRKIVDESGFYLQTDYSLDERGRTILELGPEHEIDLGGTPTSIRRANWTQYLDRDWEQRSFSGYLNTFDLSKQIVGPVTIQRFCDLAPTGYTGWRQTSVIDAEYTTPGIPTPGTAFTQSTWLRWKLGLYNVASKLKEEWTYSTIPASGYGSQSVNYGKKLFGYDTRGRLNETMCAGGTIDKTTFNSRDQPTKEELGTTAGLAITAEMVYDISGNLQKVTRPVDSTPANDRIVENTYDWRNRLTESKTVVEQAAGSSSTWTLITSYTYDNQNQVTAVTTYHTAVLSANRLSQRTTAYDILGRPYRWEVYAVASDGTLGNALTSNRYYDALDRVVREAPAGSQRFTATEYVLGLPLKTFEAYEPSGYVAGSDPAVMTEAVVVEQREMDWNRGGNQIATTIRLRFDTATGLGQLQDPATEPKARVYYAASYPDALGRTIATADYGTNGGAGWSRADTVPLRSDTILVNSTVYHISGTVESATNPAGIATTSAYDAADRLITQVENPAGSTTGSVDKRTTHYEYTDDGWLKKLKSENAVTGLQTTEWVYGVTPALGSALHSKRLVHQKIFPDSTGSSDRVTYTYNRQLQTTSMTDQNGTAHAYTYDRLGRLLVDAVTAFGSGIDTAVGQLVTTYNERGQPTHCTSRDATGTTTLNEVIRVYNDFGQIIADYQEHTGAVDLVDTRRVEYGYYDGSTNTVRPSWTQYSGGGEAMTGYLSPMADALSRPDQAGDDAMPSTFRYLGLSTPVEVASGTSGAVKFTYRNGSTGDAGDVYSGLDRFGRIVETIWETSSDKVVHSKYGRNRMGGVVWRKDQKAHSMPTPVITQDNHYWYDGLQQVTRHDRGDLTPTSGPPYTGIDPTTRQQLEVFTFDETGNWKDFNSTSMTPGPLALSHNPANEITAISASAYPVVQPVFDPCGNMIVTPTPSTWGAQFDLKWDAWNRLVEASQGVDWVNRYTYDALSRRQTYSQSGWVSNTCVYYYNLHWRPVQEFDDGSLTRIYFWNPLDRWQLLSTATFPDPETVARRCVLRDNLDTVASTDNTGGTIERYGYEAFGEARIMNDDFTPRTLTSDTLTFLFHSEFLDRGPGFYNYGYRYYHPSLGRWLSRDPIGERGGLNLYAFVGNNSPNLWDVYGLSRVTVDISFIKASKEGGEWKPEESDPSWAAGIWGLTACALLPNDVAVVVPDTNNTDIENADWFWDKVRGEIQSLLDDCDCIDKIIMRGHGFNRAVGAFNADQVAKPSSAQAKFLRWVNSRICEAGVPMDLKSCSVAEADLGKKFISDMAKASGCTVTGYDDMYAIKGYGNQWKAGPDGSPPVLQKTGDPYPRGKKDKE